MCYTTASQWGKTKQGKKVPSDASVFGDRRAGKGLNWRHPKENNSTKQLEVQMPSKPLPREHSPRAGATRVAQKVTTHPSLGADTAGSSLWVTNRNDHSLPSMHSGCLTQTHYLHTYRSTKYNWNPSRTVRKTILMGRQFFKIIKTLASIGDFLSRKGRWTLIIQNIACPSLR